MIEVSPSADGFSPEKSLNLSDLKISLMEVEVLQSPAQEDKNAHKKKAIKKKACKNKALARKERKKKMRSLTTSYPDPSVVDDLFEILQYAMEYDDTLCDDPECARVVSNLKNGTLTKESVNQKLVELHSQRC
nr:hypothetical protein [Tanacetum cinerariifolium]